MVKGLTLFAEHFKSFRDQYILIGGAACDMLHAEAGVEFRATKDLDIVLCIESLNPEFPKALWEFVRQGKYKSIEKGEGEPVFYRFHSPREDGYPTQLELFSRRPGELTLPTDAHITPITIDGAEASLSAILLDDAYYSILKNGRMEVNGISTVSSEYLIVLKARAFLDLSARKAKGEKVESDDIKKHKRDVFRLYRLVDPGVTVKLPDTVQADVRGFLHTMNRENIDLKQLGIAGQDKEKVLQTLAKIYGITDYTSDSHEGIIEA